MKRYLLDTHVAVWWLTYPRRLSLATRSLLEQADCSVSVISLWEMLSKQATRRLRLPEGPLAGRLQSAGFQVLSLTAAHVEEAAALAGLPGDPFDRLLVGTARSERMVLITRDARLLEHAAPLLSALIVEA